MKRSDGTPAQVGDRVRIENGRIFFDPPLVPDECLRAMERVPVVPNRLLGAIVLENGDVT